VEGTVTGKPGIEEKTVTSAGTFVAVLMPYVSIFTATCLGFALPPTKVAPEGVPSPTSSTTNRAEHVPEVELRT
jgi:hypothetical protein